MAMLSFFMRSCVQIARFSKAHAGKNAAIRSGQCKALRRKTEACVGAREEAGTGGGMRAPDRPIVSDHPLSMGVKRMFQGNGQPSNPWCLAFGARSASSGYGPKTPSESPPRIPGFCCQRTRGNCDKVAAKFVAELVGSNILKTQFWNGGCPSPPTGYATGGMTVAIGHSPPYRFSFRAHPESRFAVDDASVRPPGGVTPSRPLASGPPAARAAPPWASP